MKIEKVYISSFGKLKDFEYNFTDGINTIKQDNGFGKTTLATFIKCMFYGIKGAKKSVEENERTKYTPWDLTGKFGGYIIFTKKDKQYKIERFFGTKESEDSVKVIDIATGKEYVGSENIGEKLFNVDEEGFLSTTYFSQREMEIKSNASITAKYNEVCDFYDSKAFVNAIEKLEETSKKYKYSGNRGIIPDLSNELFDLNEKISISNTSSATLEKLKEEEKDLSVKTSNVKSNIEDLTKKIEKISHAEAVKLKKENYKKLCDNKSAILERKKQADSLLNNSEINEKDIKDINDGIIEYNSIVKSIQNREKDLQLLVENSKAKSTRFGLNLSLVFLSILFIVFGAIFVAENSVLGILLFVLGGLSVLGFVLTLILGKNSTNPQNVLLEKIQAELGDLYSAKNKYKNSLDNVFNSFNVDKNGDYFSMLSLLKNTADIANQCRDKIKELDAEIDKLKNDSDLNESEENLGDSESLREELKKYNSIFADLSQRLANTKASINRLEEQAESILDLESKKTQIEERIKDSKNRLNILKTTLDFLKQADENMKVKYRAPLESALNKYLAQIEGSKINALIDIDLKVSVLIDGKQKSNEFFSKGYRNLFEICKRFALVDVLFTDEKPFIVLDDPFYNLDDKKIESSINLLKKLKSEYQIIYLVCHNSRAINE